jgi:hypothetical protein
MPLNATTSLPLPRNDPETMRTTGGSEPTALPDTATAAHATQASVSVRRMAFLRRALELFAATPIIVMCFPESCAALFFFRQLAYPSSWRARARAVCSQPSCRGMDFGDGTKCHSRNIDFIQLTELGSPHRTI